MTSDYDDEQLKNKIREVMAEDKEKARQKWFHKPVSIWLGFCVLGPLVLPLVWSHPNYSLTKKIVVSIIMIGLTIAFLIISGKIVKNFYDQANDLLNMM